MALDVTDLFELLLTPRFAIPFGLGVAIGVGFYLLGGQDAASAAIAFCMGLIGLVVGVIWHIAGGSKPGAA